MDFDRNDFGSADSLPNQTVTMQLSSRVAVPANAILNNQSSISTGRTPKFRRERVDLINQSPSKINSDEHKLVQLRNIHCIGVMCQRIPINTDDGTNSKKRGTCVVCGQLTPWFCRSCMNFCCMERFPGTSTSTITEGIEVLKPDKLVAFVPNENHSDGGYCWKRTCSSVFHDKSLDQYFIKGGDSSKFLSSSMSGNSSARSALREIDLKVKNPSDRRQTM